MMLSLTARGYARWLMAAGFLLFCLPLHSQDIHFSAIEISSQPEGAAVYVEGFLLGYTPVAAQRLEPGVSYRLVIKEESYDDFVTDIPVSRGEIAKVTAELVPDSGAWQTAVRQEDDWIPVLQSQRKRYKNNKSTRSFRAYQTIEISNFLIKSDEIPPPGQRYSLLQYLARQLDQRTKFERFVTSYTPGPTERWSAEGSESGESTIVLSGVITYYRPGNRIRRAILGWGIGDTEIRCLFRITDKATNEVLLERFAQGSASGTSGSSKAMKTLAGSIAKAVAKNW